MPVIPVVSVGEIVTVDIYGKPERARILKVRPANTVDVEVLRTGKCYRISGLWINSFRAHQMGDK